MLIARKRFWLTVFVISLYFLESQAVEARQFQDSTDESKSELFSEEISKSMAENEATFRKVILEARSKFVTAVGAEIQRAASDVKKSIDSRIKLANELENELHAFEKENTDPKSARFSKALANYRAQVQLAQSEYRDSMDKLADKSIPMSIDHAQRILREKKLVMDAVWSPSAQIDDEQASSQEVKEILLNESLSITLPEAQSAIANCIHSSRKRVMEAIALAAAVEADRNIAINAELDDIEKAIIDSHDLSPESKIERLKDVREKRLEFHSTGRVHDYILSVGLRINLKNKSEKLHRDIGEMLNGAAGEVITRNLAVATALVEIRDELVSGTDRWLISKSEEDSAADLANSNGSLATAVKTLPSGKPSKVLDIDLVSNGDCEARSDKGGVPHWEIVSGDWVSLERWDRPGEYFFRPIGKKAVEEIRQDIDISAVWKEVSGSVVTVTVGGSVCGHYQRGAGEETQVVVEYLDRRGENVGKSLNYGPVHSGNWLEFSLMGEVPASARTIRLRLVSHRRRGTSNDGFFDDLSLKLSSIPR